MMSYMYTHKVCVFLYTWLIIYISLRMCIIGSVKFIEHLLHRENILIMFLTKWFFLRPSLPDFCKTYSVRLQELQGVCWYKATWDECTVDPSQLLLNVLVYTIVTTCQILCSMLFIKSCSEIIMKWREECHPIQTLETFHWCYEHPA